MAAAVLVGFLLAGAAGFLIGRHSVPTPRPLVGRVEVPRHHARHHPDPSSPHQGPSRRELVAVHRLAARGLPLYCGASRRRMVALTFDDGPGPYTKLTLRKLAAAHLQATFFLVGKEIRAFPRVAPQERRVAALGDHTMTHPFLPALAPAQARAEIAADRSLLARTVHQAVTLFRPPYGGHDRMIDRLVRHMGLLQVLWSVDSADSLGADYHGIERNVLAGLRPGAIILMHENRGQTIRALPVIIRALARRHLRAVTIPQLVALDRPSLKRLGAGEKACGIRLRRRSGG